jgi:glucose/arabinose dehydrogenase
MTPLRLATLLGCAALVALTPACGGSEGSSDAGVVTGPSRIAWDQPASNAAEVATLRFVMYVDGARNELTGASCAPPATVTGFPCSAPLPSMTPGQHTIQLASYVQAGTIVESGKSQPLVITVAGANITTGATVPAPTLSAPESLPSAAAAARGEVLLAGGVRLGVEMVAAIEGPTALAIAPDGTAFIGDSRGAIHVARDGSVVGTAWSSDAAAAEGTAVLDLLVDAQFARTRLVYALEVTSGSSRAFQLARYRELNDRFGQRAVLLDRVPASSESPAAALTSAGDRLFVALDDGGVREVSQRPGAYNGKILRLNADGTTPADQPGSNPVYASGLASPRSAAWDPATASLWLADTGTGRAERRQQRGRGIVATAYDLQLAGGPAALALYRSTLIPSLQGSLLVAPAEERGFLLRARVGDSDGNVIGATERLMLPGSPRVRLLKVGPDGSIYVGTEHEILRIAPR